MQAYNAVVSTDINFVDIWFKIEVRTLKIMIFPKDFDMHKIPDNHVGHCQMSKVEKGLHKF